MRGDCVGWTCCGCGSGVTSGVANPFDTTSLTDGTHTITAVVDRTAGPDVTIDAEFTVDNPDGLSLVVRWDMLAYHEENHGQVARCPRRQAAS